jgi:hypothetical protein
MEVHGAPLAQSDQPGRAKKNRRENNAGQRGESLVIPWHRLMWPVNFGGLLSVQTHNVIPTGTGDCEVKYLIRDMIHNANSSGSVWWRANFNGFTKGFGSCEDRVVEPITLGLSR